MFDQLKKMAMQRLASKMLSNSLGADATQAAASEGASALMDTIKQKMSGGNMSEVTDLFSGGGNMENNGIFQNLQGKMSEILQSKGMSAEEAEAEAKNTAPDLVNSLKEKFQSSDEADKDFDLSALTGMLGGNAGDLLGKVKNLF